MLPAAPQSNRTAAPAQQHHPLVLPLLLLLLLLLLPAVDLALALLRQ